MRSERCGYTVQFTVSGPREKLLRLLLVCQLMIGASAAAMASATASATGVADAADRVRYRSIDVDGVNIFYREAGDASRPTLLLLHGFSASSHMFRDLLPLLSDRFHLVAPDYPGFGYSDAPSPALFEPTFEQLEVLMSRFVRALGLKSFVLYLQDFGGPVGLRMAVKHPEWIDGLIVQNANAYKEGLPPQQAANGAGAKTSDQVVNPAFIRFLYQDGARNVAGLNPDAWTVDIAALQRPGAHAIQAALIDDYHNNLAEYATWQAWFREHQPRTLVVWGRKDRAFPPAAAEAFRRDLRSVEVHYFDTGHFALEEDSAGIARAIKDAF